MTTETKEAMGKITYLLSMAITLTLIVGSYIVIIKYRPGLNDKLIADLKAKISRDSVLIGKQQGQLNVYFKLAADQSKLLTGQSIALKNQQALIVDYDFQLRRALKLAEHFHNSRINQ